MLMSLYPNKKSEMQNSPPPAKEFDKHKNVSFLSGIRVLSVIYIIQIPSNISGAYE